MVSRTCGTTFFSRLPSISINKEYKTSSTERRKIIDRVNLFDSNDDSNEFQSPPKQMTSGSKSSRSDNSIKIARNDLNNLIRLKNDYELKVKTKENIKDFLTNVNNLTSENRELNKVLGARNRVGYCFLSNMARAQRICTIINDLNNKTTQPHNSNNYTDNPRTAQIQNSPNNPTNPTSQTQHPHHTGGMRMADIIPKGSNNSTNNNHSVSKSSIQTSTPQSGQPSTPNNTNSGSKHETELTSTSAITPSQTRANKNVNTYNPTSLTKAETHPKSQQPNPAIESQTPKAKLMLWDVIEETIPQSNGLQPLSAKYTNHPQASLSNHTTISHIPQAINHTSNSEPKTPNTTNNQVLENNINIPTVDEVAKQAGEIVEKGLGLATEIAQERFGQLNDEMNALSNNLNKTCDAVADQFTELRDAATSQFTGLVTNAANTFNRWLK